METLHLIVTIADERVALPATHVESVIEVMMTIPVPRAAPHVAGLAALRSRVITLIDCRTALGFAGLASAAALREAVVVAIDGHSYGLIVDRVEDAVPAERAPDSLGAGLAPAWRAIVTGMVVVGDALLPVLDAAQIVAGPARAAAA